MIKNWKIPLYKIFTDDEDVDLITKIVKRGSSWALGPEIEEFENELQNYVGKNGLKFGEYNSYANHYSETLIIWREIFNKKWDLIKKQGFDLKFKKMWEFYLSYCEAGFKSKNIDLIQFSLQNK